MHSVFKATILQAIHRHEATRLTHRPLSLGERRSDLPTNCSIAHNIRCDPGNTADFCLFELRRIEVLADHEYDSCRDRTEAYDLGFLPRISGGGRERVEIAPTIV